MNGLLVRNSPESDAVSPFRKKVDRILELSDVFKEIGVLASELAPLLLHGSGVERLRLSKLFSDSWPSS
jgi:hypothetical protein